VIALKIFLGIVLYLLGVSFLMSVLGAAIRRVNPDRKDRP
jgi:hypothetical protein